MVTGAFFDNNPITFLDNFKNNLIKAKTFNEMLDKSASFLGLNKIQAREFLKMILRYNTTTYF
ncbi:MAG: hypothetical protein ACE5SW_12630 [Nitrososphaeraceae archaeon]